MKPQRQFIFLVDDDIDDQELFMEALQVVDSNIICRTATNGEEALAYLQADLEVYPDFIFLDLNMPRLNGKQCLMALKKNEALRHIPVVIYTTSSQQRDIDEVMALGASHFVTKPCNFKELCDLLRLMLVDRVLTEQIMQKNS